MLNAKCLILNVRHIVNGVRSLSIKHLALSIVFLYPLSLPAATIVATVNENPITDIDIRNRVRLMPTSLNNREAAKNAIIDDLLKIEHANQFRITPTDQEVSDAIRNHTVWREHPNNPQTQMAARANIAWQMFIMRAIMPTITVTDEDIRQELLDLQRERGLPEMVDFIRVINMPEAMYRRLTQPASCAAAERMVRDLGGVPLRMQEQEFELNPEVRREWVEVPLMTWTPLKEGRTYLVCSRERTSEWGELDDIIQQNAKFKRAFFQADQVLKGLRRRAAIIN